MALQAQLPPANTPEPYRYDEKSDFTGGLNLRADQFNLGETESPSLLNVSVDPRGGVRRRNGVTKVNATELSNEINRLMTHYESGQNQILATTIDTGAAQSQLYYNDDASGNFTGPVQSDGTYPRYFNGQIPLVQIYNKALSATEVLDNFETERTRFGV